MNALDNSKMHPRSIVLSIIMIGFPASFIWGQGTHLLESNKDFDNCSFQVIWDSFVYPQVEQDKELLQVTYKSIDCDPVFAEGKTEGRWLLQVGTRCSRFVTEARFKGDSLYKDNAKRFVRINQWTRQALFITIHDAYYQEPFSGKLIFTGRLVGDDYLYEEPLPALSWERCDSVRTICGYLCQLAKCAFRGREYSAFFTEEIPVSFGPWKLQGLPGLILEAYDSEGRIHFVAESIRPSGGNIGMANYPYIRISRKEYAKMVRQMQEQYRVFANSHISRTDIVRIGLDNSPGKSRNACIPLEIE